MAVYNQSEGGRFRGDRFGGKQGDQENNRVPFSRLFVVCGKHHEADDLRDAFQEYGTIEDLFVVKDKTTKENRGIAYIQYEKMSEACLAIESLHGKRLTQEDSGARLKVIMAQAREGETKDLEDETVLTRLFVQVPNGIEESYLRESFSKFGDIDYVNVIKNRRTGEKSGFGFIKYHRAYDAAKALEEADRCYRAVMAEPKAAKTKRKMGANDMGSHQGSMGRGDAMKQLPSISSFGFDDRGGAGNRLQVNCALSVTADQLARLFDIIPGMELCDLKRNFSTGESKGVAVVVYNTVTSATYAKEKLNGFEYPVNCKLTVRYAPDDEQIGTNEIGNGSLVSPMGNIPSGSGLHYCSIELPLAKPIVNSEEVVERLFIVCSPPPPPSHVLVDVFSRFGDLIDVFILQNKTFGYAKFSSHEGAQKAMQALHGAEVYGSTLKVIPADPKPKTEESVRKRPRT